MRKAVAQKAAKLFSCILLSATMVCSLAPASAFAITSAEAQAQANAALAQLDQLTAVLEQAENDHFAAMTATLEAQAKVAEAQQKIETATARIKELQDKLGGRARSMYRSGGSSILDLVFGATSFEEFATNWSLLERLNQNDADMVAETKTLRKEIEEEKVVLEEQQKLAEQHEAEAKAIVEQVTEAQAQMRATYEALSAEAAQLFAAEQQARAAAQAAAVGDVMAAATASGGNYTAAAYNAATGNSIVDRAMAWVGNAEYVWGGCSPGAFDCSGFVSYALTGSYNRLGTTHTFMNWGQTNDPQPGDVCVNNGHTGIYIGNGQMVHSATEGVGVIVGPVQSGMIFVRP